MKYKIFISYRRNDSAYASSPIYDRLAQEFGKENVFKDVDSIPLGVNFKKYLQDEVSKCNVFLAVVGEKWLNITDDKGKRRLEDPTDFVRIEIETALKRGIPLIPLLIQNISMPNNENLPETMKEFSYRNALEIRAGRDLHRDIDGLIKHIYKIPIDTNLWPEAGTDFLLNLRSLLKLKTKFSFITEVGEVKKEIALNCFLDKNWHYCIWFNNKRREKIDVIWGLYSLKLRDPAFRDLCSEIQESCRKQIPSQNFQFNPSEMGVETKKRVIIGNLLNQELCKEINEYINALDTVCYPLVKNARKDLLPDLKKKFLSKFANEVTKKILTKEKAVQDKDNVCWEVSNKWFYSLYINERYYPYIDICWGFYSENKKRDPQFRSICKEIEENFKNLNNEIVIDNDTFCISTEQLGLETKNKIRIYDFQNDQELTKSIARSFFKFYKKSYPIIQKYISDQ